MVAYETDKAKNSRRTRVREVDFMRVEDASTRDSLSPFEMEVKDKIAAEMPLLKKALEAEERRIKEQLARVFKAKLNKLLSRGILTERQREFYELFYVKKLTGREIAQIMGVSLSRVRTFRLFLKKSLKKAVMKDKQREFMSSRVKHVQLTRIQKSVWRLYQREGLSVTEIARRLGKTRQSVDWVFQNLKKKFYG